MDRSFVSVTLDGEPDPTSAKHTERSPAATGARVQCLHRNHDFVNVSLDTFRLEGQQKPRP